MDDCDNCGAPADDLIEVHRVYVTPATWDQEGSSTRVPDVERWCVGCRLSYPHDAVVE